MSVPIELERAFYQIQKRRSELARIGTEGSHAGAGDISGQSTSRPDVRLTMSVDERIMSLVDQVLLGNENAKKMLFRLIANKTISSVMLMKIVDRLVVAGSDNHAALAILRGLCNLSGHLKDMIHRACQQKQRNDVLASLYEPEHPSTPESTMRDEKRPAPITSPYHRVRFGNSPRPF